MSSETTSEERIVEYCDSCEIDYRLIWDLNKSLAMHFGYWDDEADNFSQALERENEILAEKANIEKSSIVLDAGCGVGGSAIYLAKKFGCTVIGITLSQKQADSSTKNAKESGVGHLAEFYKMDFSKTTFKDKYFDVVWAIESVCHADDKKSFIKEAFRVLKEGGRLVLADGFASKNQYDPSERSLMKKWLNGWGVNFLETSEYFKKYSKEAGFKNISFLDVTKNVIPSSRRLYIYSFPALLFGRSAEFVRMRTKIQTGNIVAAHYQYKALKRRLWKYGIFYAEK